MAEKRLRYDRSIPGDTTSEAVVLAFNVTDGAAGDHAVLPPSHRLLHLTTTGLLKAGSITPQYSLDGETWLSIDADLEGRAYPQAVADGAAAKNPATFLLPPGACFRVNSSAAQNHATPAVLNVRSSL